MAAANGTAVQGILRLGSLVPERLPVQFEHEVLRDGRMVTEEVVLQGYVYGPTCPGLVKAECAAAEEKRQAAFADAAATNATKEAAWIDFLRLHILSLVPGMSFTDADVLAGNTQGAIALLRGLGAWIDAAEGDGEALDADPLSTTLSSLLTSSAATDPTTT